MCANVQGFLVAVLLAFLSGGTKDPGPSDVLEDAPNIEVHFQAATSTSATDYGIVGGDPTVATENVLALVSLIAPAEYGGASDFKGELIFPGAQTYYFDDDIPVKDGIHLNLQGSTLHFSKGAEDGDQSIGFFHVLRDFTIENGTFEVDYDGTGHVHAGKAMTLGTRNSLGSPYYNGIYDADMSEPMGNILVKNMTFVSNNPNTSIISMLGGLEDVVFEDVSFDGHGLAPRAIGYEFGNGTPRDKNGWWKSSHGHNMKFLNITVNNLDPEKRAAMRFGGAYDVLVDGLTVTGAKSALASNQGEAAFFDTWGEVSERPTITIRNLTASQLSGVAVILGGSGLFKNGYLGKLVPNASFADQTDHLWYIVENFDLTGNRDGSGVGIAAAGAGIDLRNGTIRGFRSGIRVNNDCTEIYIDSVKILDSWQMAIQLNFEYGIWEPPRLKTGYIKNSTFSGSGLGGDVFFAIGMNHVGDFLIENNSFGYENEEHQGNAVFIASDSRGVVAYNNTVNSVAPGEVAFRSLAPSRERNVLQGNTGITSARGGWRRRPASEAPPPTLDFER